MNETSQFWPIILNLIASFFGAFGQYFYKLGSKKLSTTSIYANVPLILGVIFFTAVMVLFVAAFKMGGRLSVVFPFYAVTFLWGTLIGYYLENESIAPLQWVGTAFVVFGLCLIAATART